MTPSSDTDAGIAERGMGLGLRALNRIAGSELLDRVGIRKPLERAVYRTTKSGFRSATAAGRTFKAAQQLGKPARQAKGKSKGLFDLTPNDEQQMFQEAGRAFAEEKIRPAALDADAACATPPELLAQAAELGVNMLGVPEELGGVMHEQAAVSSVLIGEALAHGDMGIAYAALAPGAVASAIGLWGSAEQEATYLPAFTGEDVPAAALAMLEPRPLFDPLKLETKARRVGSEWVLDGAKSLLARAAECELFLVAAEAEGIGPALFVIESGASGLSVEPEPAMGLRAAAHRPPGAGGGAAAGRRPARRGPPRGLRASASSARGSPGAGWRSAPPRRCSTTSSPTSRRGPPSASRSPTARRWPSRSPTSASSPKGCASRPTGRRAAPTRGWALGGRLRSRAGSAPRRGCRSAPQECSCSAGTATSPSTRSSAGTETSARRA